MADGVSGYGLAAPATSDQGPNTVSADWSVPWEDDFDFAGGDPDAQSARRICRIRDRVDPEIVEAPVPTVGPGVNEAETHRGLVVGFRQRVVLDAFGPDWIVIDAGLQVGGEVG